MKCAIVSGIFASGMACFACVAIGQLTPSAGPSTQDSIARILETKPAAAGATEEEVRQWLRSLSDTDYTKRNWASAQLRKYPSISVPIAVQDLSEQNGEALDRCLSFLGEVISDSTSPYSSVAFNELKRLAQRTDGSRSVQISQTFNTFRITFGEQTWKRISKLCPEPRREFFSRAALMPFPNPLEINALFEGTAADLEGLDQVTWIRFARLEGPKIDRDVLRAVLKLPQLNHLQIVNAPITAKDLAVLKDGPDLNVLELMYLPIDDEILSVVQEIPVWGALWIFGSKISPAGGDELVRVLNDVKVDILKGAYLGVKSLSNSLQVESVEVGSAAEEAMIRKGDRITSLNGIKLENFEHLRRELGKFAPLENVTLELERIQKNLKRQLEESDQNEPLFIREKITVEVTLGRRSS